VAEKDLSDQLSARALDTVDTVVDTVHDKAIRPALVAARSIVFGVIIAVVGITVLVIFFITIIRIGVIAGREVWRSYLLIGLILSAIGALLYSRRGLPPDA
jgi:hypothetical protein